MLLAGAAGIGALIARGIVGVGSGEKVEVTGTAAGAGNSWLLPPPKGVTL